MKAKVIGAGLAGAEAAIYLADRGVSVELYDIKPHARTPAHHSPLFGELVCSNSLKSNDVYNNACGLLKEEMRILGSAVIAAADETRVPAGNALAVNREAFAEKLTGRIRRHPNISFFPGEVTALDCGAPTIVATGPLTTEALSAEIARLTGGALGFYDASAPIVSGESVDMTRAFVGDRYRDGAGDHINCPMDREEYLAFYRALVGAQRADLHAFEREEIFEGCMPVEVMAARGEDTLRFGPLKPKGLRDPVTKKPHYACLQLRKEDAAGEMYNLVGFQTNLTFPEQKRVFSMIPALKNAEFYRYGVMHRNTYIDAPSALENGFLLKGTEAFYFAGQITGVEGYVESAASGLVAAMNLYRTAKGRERISFSDETVLGALVNYASRPNENYQPMNANYGILQPLPAHYRDKAEKKRQYALRSLAVIQQLKEESEWKK